MKIYLKHFFVFVLSLSLSLESFFSFSFFFKILYAKKFEKINSLDMVFSFFFFFFWLLS